jgi:Domain of unknown function (DUF4136)
MNGVVGLLVVLLSVAQPPAEGKVASEYDKKADFTVYRTYTWQKGHEAYDRAAHKLLVAAIDRELAALGLRKDDGGTPDLTVTYHSLRSAEVNLKEVEKLEREGNAGQAPTYDMGKLLIVVREASTRRQLWAANTLEYLSKDPAAREQIVQRAVTRLFETYPTRKK